MEEAVYKYMHDINNFISTQCEVSLSNKASSTDLYIAYLDWADHNHTTFNVTHKKFTEYLKSLSYISISKSNIMIFKGIGLKKITIFTPNTNLYQKVFISIVDGLNKDEIIEKHWPNISYMKGRDALKGVLNQLRNKHRWLCNGRSFDITPIGFAKYDELKKNKRH